MKIIELDEAFGRRYLSYHDELQQYDRDQSNLMNRGRGMIDDEANIMYWYDNHSGRLKQRSVSNHDENAAKSQGWRFSQKDALRVAGIIPSKFHQGKWVKKEGTKWVEVHPYGKPEGVAESATAGATSAANIGTVDAPHISPGKARGKKSYTGSMSTGSGTKAPPQPKVKQPKNKDGTAVNGLDIKGASLFGGSTVKRR